MYNTIIAKRIIKLCKERGLSFTKLARMSGLNQSTVDSIVRGVTKDPRISTIHCISNGFGMTISEFLDIEELNALFME